MRSVIAGADPPIGPRSSAEAVSTLAHHNGAQVAVVPMPPSRIRFSPCVLIESPVSFSGLAPESLSADQHIVVCDQANRSKAVWVS